MWFMAIAHGQNRVKWEEIEAHREKKNTQEDNGTYNGSPEAKMYIIHYCYYYFYFYSTYINIYINSIPIQISFTLWIALHTNVLVFKKQKVIK